MKMPIYSQEITLPTASETVNTVQIVVRYYGPYQNSYAQLPSPKLTVDGAPLKLLLVFPSNTSQFTHYSEGSKEGGYDQFSQYYAQDVHLSDQEKRIVIQGPFEQIAYLSITLYYYLYDDITGEQYTYLDNGLPTDSENLNPYQVGNPSVFAFDSSTKNADAKTSTFEKQKSSSSYTEDDGIDINNKIQLYRPDQVSSSTKTLEDVADDGCSKDYLTTEITESGLPPYHMYDFLILRLKVPSTFIHNDTPDKVFQDYQCRYISINSNIQKYDTDSLDFWTINPIHLEKYLDHNRRTYVFFAPNDYVRELVKGQGLAPKTPPVVTWNGITGYVLGYPSYGVIIRYRAPNDNWEGNPVKCPCYSSPETNEPVKYWMMSPYTPELFGDTLENFKKKLHIS
ncbi:hypothetical protein [Pseudotenacibaculum haliotis]|uniref:Uncharacterized protein n=1 Tax=Pseudotenacibaculum haliotis TaxID=1862138 RepID=A0ABW5LNJ2_9FLAO